MSGGSFVKNHGQKIFDLTIFKNFTFKSSDIVI